MVRVCPYRSVRLFVVGTTSIGILFQTLSLLLSITNVVFFPHSYLENRITALTSSLLWTQMQEYGIGLAVCLDLHMILGNRLILQ